MKLSEVKHAVCSIVHGDVMVPSPNADITATGYYQNIHSSTHANLYNPVRKTCTAAIIYYMVRKAIILCISGIFIYVNIC